MKPMTFPSPEAHLVFRANNIIANSLQFRLQFRTFDNDRLLIYNYMNNQGYFEMKISPEGYVNYALLPDSNSFAIVENAKSGKWDCSPNTRHKCDDFKIILRHRDIIDSGAEFGVLV